MKTLKQFRVWVLMVTLVSIFSGTEKASAQVNVNVSFQTFYDQLSPYGYWMNTPNYGYVWQPNVSSNFQPYATNGYWVMTEYGNTWVSEYDWGWAPFHYGRWYYDNYYGWLWMPDNEWGPGWVSWRSGDGYYGWAPMGPGMNVNVVIPVSSWIFVPNVYITNRRFYDYCIPRSRVVNVYHHTTIVNNYYTYNNRRYSSGPSIREIERHTHSRVQVHRVQHDERPGRSRVNEGSVRVYRPNVSERRDNTPVPVNNGPGRRMDNSAGRSQRENWGSPDRNDQSQRPDRNPSQPQNRSAERIDMDRSNRNDGFIQPARSQDAQESRGSRTTVEPAQRQANRQPSFENNSSRPDWGTRNQGSENRTVQPREQRQFNQEAAPQQQRQERIEPPQIQRTEPQQQQRMERTERSQPQQMQRQERVENRSQPQAQPQRQEPQRQERSERPAPQASPSGRQSRQPR